MKYAASAIAIHPHTNEVRHVLLSFSRRTNAKYSAEEIAEKYVKDELKDKAYSYALKVLQVSKD